MELSNTCAGNTDARTCVMSASCPDPCKSHPMPLATQWPCFVHQPQVQHPHAMHITAAWASDLCQCTVSQSPSQCQPLWPDQPTGCWRCAADASQAACAAPPRAACKATSDPAAPPHPGSPPAPSQRSGVRPECRPACPGHGPWTWPYLTGPPGTELVRGSTLAAGVSRPTVLVVALAVADGEGGLGCCCPLPAPLRGLSTGSCSTPEGPGKGSGEGLGEGGATAMAVEGTGQERWRGW